MTVRELVKRANGRLIKGDPAVSVDGFSIDTRTLSRGDAFFAIKGPNHDGHDFVDKAFKRGAAGAVVSKLDTKWRERAGIFLVEVTDTAKALGLLGNRVRHERPAVLIGITGSTGKTTTKDIIGKLLEKRFSPLVSEGNYNNLYGLPLTLLKRKPGHDTIVCEMGISYPGEMTELAKIADPDTAVYTNIKPVHMMNFDSLSDIAGAKGEMLEVMGGGTAVINGDSPELKEMVKGFPGRVLSFGMENPGDLTACIKDDRGIYGTTAEFIRPDGDSRVFKIRLPGIHNVYNVLAAVLCVLSMGMELKECAGIIETVGPVPGRGGIRKLGNDVVIVDETYNSNPESLESVLDMLEKTKAGGRKILVAGDMLELGVKEKEYHLSVGEYAADRGVNMLITAGTLSRYMSESAERRGVETAHFEKSEEAGRYLAERAGTGDLIVVKGSRGMRMERAIEVFTRTTGEAV